MTLTILVLVLVSSGLHPLREFIIKGSPTPEGVTLSATINYGVLSAAHLAVSGVDPLSAIEVWPLALISGLGVIAYYLGILRTLRHVGSFLLQYRPGARFFSQPRTLALAILVMCAHGMITLVDAEAMKSAEPMAFIFLVFVFVIPAMAIVLIITRPAGRTVYHHLFIGWIQTPFPFFISGLTSYVSYYLILLAFQMGANVASVASVRQISIPLSVVLGGLILKEARMFSRLGWSLLLAGGVVLIIFSK